MLPQQYCLRWKYHHSNLQTMFSQLLDRGCFCDVTLACEGQLIRAHRVVLCACSTFFDTVLTNYASERDPIIIMKDVTFADIKCLIEFMYKGEINVEHANLASLLKTADDLKIKGLAEVTWRDDEDIPPPPTPQTEFHSPSQSRSRDLHNYDSYVHEAQHRSHSPDAERERKTPSPNHSAIATRMPTLTPIPTSAVSIVTAAGSPIDSYLGPKRKRGRPPLDDAYDVFNVRKLGNFSDQGDSSSYLEGSQYHEEPNNRGATTQRSRPNSPSAASVVYQQHVQQQKNRLRYRPPRVQRDDEQLDDESATEPEWITSSLEPENEPKDPLAQADEGDEELHDIKEERDDDDNAKLITEKRSKDASSEYHKSKAPKRTSSKEDMLKHKSERKEDFEVEESTNVPQTVEEIENVKSSTKEKPSTSTTIASAAATSNSSSSATSSSSSLSPSTSAAPKTSSQSHSHHHHSHHSHHSHSHHAAPPPPLHHPHHYGKYVPDGYMINEHGILMTHDFIHAPTASIPTSSSSASNGHHPDEYVDIKMEEYNEAELRLTSEEMSQWQDVIKMDDYLAKGRRPQFWEEPFTRRVCVISQRTYSLQLFSTAFKSTSASLRTVKVLDAIKNKRLEMKKAARILGVSYGTLYGRYREVYGCLKHPYSSTSMRPSQSSSLSVQPRFDVVWPSPKPGQLDIGKLRPKDLSELWARPQM